MALAVPLVDRTLLVARRPAGTHLEGRWEFPGGKIRGGEKPSSAARRELREETGLDATALEPLLVLVHEYPERAVRLHVFLARDPRGRVVIEDSREWGWKTLDEIGRLQMPEANTRILHALRRRLP